MHGQLLDFIIIGAQKAGTTSLFKYLEAHPQIYMPPEKEAPYFNVEERVARGWAWYLQEYFSEAPGDQLWGKATPEYLAHPRVPERLWATLPEAKLIAILRHPVERAYSEYRMALRRGLETRPLQEAIQALLTPEALHRARQEEPGVPRYIVKGEYGRALAAYRHFFPRRQMLVTFTEEMQRVPHQVLRSVLQFLEVDAEFVPDNLGTVYHKGGSRRRLPWTNRLRKWRHLNALARQMIPVRQRRRFWYWFEQWNVVADKVEEAVPADVRQLLSRHYLEDIRALSELIERTPPWDMDR